MAKPSNKALGKRKAPAPLPSSKGGNKKSKPSKGKDSNVAETGPTGKPKRKPEQPKKVKLRDQKSIPIPKTTFAAKGKSTRTQIDEDEDEDEDELDDLGEEEGMEAGNARFLLGVDEGALSRSVKETKRLHDLSKEREPIPKLKRQKLKIPLPPSRESDSEDYDFDSDPELDSDLSSNVDDDEVEISGSEDGLDSGSNDDDDEDSVYDSGASLDMTSDEDQDDVVAAFDNLPSEEEEDVDLVDSKRRKKGKKGLEDETDYEAIRRSKLASKPKINEEDKDENQVEVGRLPIKLPTGEIQMVEGSTKIQIPQPKKKPAPPPPSDTEEEEEEEEDEDSDDGQQAEKMAGQKGKFGRMGVAEIVGMKGWKNAQRLESAKEQMAALGAEILAGGELVDIGPVLTRLSTFALPTVPSLDEGESNLPVPASIRGLAFLSQLAVYKDLIPGYRIRDLTAIEEAEKVRDEVKRLREGEKLLVKSYKGYLKMLEQEIKRRSPLASLSLRCMCELLVGVTHFNFSENLMGVLVGKLGRKGWDSDADLVLETFISVFRNDISGVHAQTLVRLIARMIKERHFQVNPNVLTCLLHLRLRNELDQMKRGKNAKGGAGGGSGDKKDQPTEAKKFKSDIRKQWATKNQRKKQKELKEVEKEMKEAEAEVDKEERAQVQTETLKNLFVLYFSILKSPTRTPLLPSALEGISAYAHFINIDFFRDLLAVLRKIISDQLSYDQDNKTNDGSDDEDEDPNNKFDQVGASNRIRIRLLSISTAFEILSGQGEALNIDLGDFINHLFGLLRPISLDTGIEDPPLISTTARSSGVNKLSTSTLLLQCLESSFFSRNAGRSPPYRIASFSKRLIECSLHFPPITAKQAIAFSRKLMAKEPKLESMLDTEEKMSDGVYKPEFDDPQLLNPFATSLWESNILADKYWDRSVREEMRKMRDNKAI
ncbi:uncharacterized protein IL334_007173 [Kwoniella shivajii]|uniref:Nucleolar complex-associated protein 3 n=1 Tax=Kwoniella shivajii TaxID=564305 RepID=A0ABZ1D7X9_9TREE|nr:hypothetical protein IL334_007173 [Kwoniella shivajii]